MKFQEVKRLVLEAIALCGINGLAFVYNAQYIPLAIGVDCLVLGIETKGAISK